MMGAVTLLSLAAAVVAAAPPGTLPTAWAAAEAASGTTPSTATTAAAAPVPHALQVVMDRLKTEPPSAVPTVPCSYRVVYYVSTRAADGLTGPYRVYSAVTLRKGPWRGVKVELSYRCEGGDAPATPVTCTYVPYRPSVLCGYLPSLPQCTTYPVVEPRAAAVLAAVPTYAGFCDGHPAYPPGEA